MKRFIYFLIVSAALLAAGCSEYDDSGILSRLEKLEKDVAELKADVARANSDIAALRTLIDVVQQNQVKPEDIVSVTSVKAVEKDGVSGWQINFSDGRDPITIWNGKDSSAPVMGVTTIDGILYWTVNGVPVIDPSTLQKIPVRGKDGINGTNGITPKLKIEDGYWYVSYDDEKTWIKLDKATSGSGSGVIFRSVEVVGGNVVFTLSDGTQYTIPLISVAKTSVFDENDIVLSLGAVSDVHIGNGYGSEAKFTAALNQLKMRAAEQDANGLDAVVVAGDLINTKNTGQISTFKSLYEQVFDPKKVPMIYTVGNHDMNGGYAWSANTVADNAAFHSILGDDYFLTDQDQTARKNFECRHCIVGNYHILCVTPNSSKTDGSIPTVYDAQAITWLNSKLKAITEANPDRYVMVVTHPMIYNTVYGSDLGRFWYTESLTSILEGYPQVVTFSGHLHFPLNDPRSIWQGTFTSLGCASVSYMAFEGGNYVNKSSSTVLKDAGEFSEGLLVQFDRSGNARFTRMDFYRSAAIGKPWIIDAPKGDKSHLATYDHVALAAANEAPTLSTLDVEIGELSDGRAPVTACWAAGSDDEFVHHYSYTLSKGGTVVDSKLVMSDFYRSPQVSMMKSEYEMSLGTLESGDYVLSLSAVDSWGAVSAPIEKAFTVGEPKYGAWVNDAAGNTAFDGGSGSVSGSWVSYSTGSVSWTANNTGKPRSEEITLPNGLKYTVTQLVPSDFKGTWSFRAQRFSKNSNVTSEASDITFDVTFQNPLYGETLTDYNGIEYTNNLGLSGLYLNAVADATVVIDYANKTVKFGLFLDERKAQPVSNGKSGYPYVCFIPECATNWMASPWNFVPVPIHASQNYTWLWFNVSSDFSTLNYDQPNKQYLPGTSSGASMIIGITCAVCANATPAASDINSTYDVIYQANPNKVNTNGGFTLTRK